MESETGVEGGRAEGALCGVVVDGSGLIVAPGDIFPEPGGEPRETLVPADFKIHAEGERAYAATAVGIDRSLNLAFLRAEPAALPHLKPVKFREGAPFSVGDPIVIVGALGRKYGFAPAIFQATINAQTQGIVTLYGVDTILQDLTVGGLVLRRDGSAAGIVAKDILLEDLDQARSPGNLLSIIANMGQPQVRKPGYAMVMPYAAFAKSLAAPPPLDLAPDLKHAWIGIVMQALSDDLRDYWKLPVSGGIIVGSVIDGSPAQAAGLRQGDVLTSLEGEPLKITEDAQLAEFRRRIEIMGAGRQVDVDAWRDGRPMRVHLTLGEAPKTASRAEEYKDEDFGLTVREITIDVQQALNLDPSFQGVVVADLEESGWADVAGLGPDDIILSVNGVKVAKVQELRDALNDVKHRRDTEAVFFVMRPPDTLFVRVKTDFGRAGRE
jgi:S1-C subfamily serine protease